MSIKNIFQRKSTLIKRHNKARLDFKFWMKRPKNETNAKARRVKQMEKGMLKAESGVVE